MQYESAIMVGNAIVWCGSKCTGWTWCRTLNVPPRVGSTVGMKGFGEVLSAFGSGDGRAGLVDPVCPHRGVILVVRRNEACGIRCAYHGWTFDGAGGCVDMPTMPPESGFRETVGLC